MLEFLCLISISTSRLGWDQNIVKEKIVLLQDCTRIFSPLFARDEDFFICRSSIDYSRLSGLRSMAEDFCILEDDELAVSRCYPQFK